MENNKLKFECFKYLADKIFSKDFKNSLNISKKTPNVPSSVVKETPSVPSVVKETPSVPFSVLKETPSVPSTYVKETRCVPSSYKPIIKKNSKPVPLNKVYFSDNTHKRLKSIKKRCSNCLLKGHSVIECLKPKDFGRCDSCGKRKSTNHSCDDIDEYDSIDLIFE